jgi:hypothetical protein
MRLYTIPGNNTFADVYGSGTYSNGTYGCDSTTTTCTNASSTAANGGNSLANTGILVGLVVGVAAVLLLVVVLVRFWRRPVRSAEAVPIEADDETDAQNEQR